MKPSSTETVIEGRWLRVHGRIVGDENANRIDELIASHFQRVAAGNWVVLYRDPDDGRL